jgi:hypothetical protein
MKRILMVLALCLGLATVASTVGCGGGSSTTKPTGTGK